MSKHDDQLRKCRQALIMELYERRRGSDNDVQIAEAIEDLPRPRRVEPEEAAL